MAYTNKTTNYDLPQYVADDTPKYLSDFNEAMQKIDTAIKSVDDKTTANATNVNTALSNSQEALENSQTAQSTANTSLATANTNKNILHTFFEGFNNIDNWPPTV